METPAAWATSLMVTLTPSSFRLLHSQRFAPAVGTWLSLGSVTAARFLARAGLSGHDLGVWILVHCHHSSADAPGGNARARRGLG